MVIKRMFTVLKSCNYDIGVFINNHVIPHINNHLILDVAKKRHILLPKEYGKYGININGILYTLSSFNDSIFWQVENEYNYDDIQSEDIILDIGANIGYFSLRVSNQCRKVFSVEPLYMNELRENIQLNKLQDKITVLPYALSLFDTDVQFDGRAGRATGKTLTELIHLCGGRVNVLKCDCEGGEWIITPNQLQGIRRIEMEIHRFNGENIEKLIKELFVDYDVIVDRENHDTVMVHAFLKKDKVSSL